MTRKLYVIARCVSIKHVEPISVKAFVKCLYFFPVAEAIGEDYPIHVLVDLYDMASMYEVPWLAADIVGLLRKELRVTTQFEQGVLVTGEGEGTVKGWIWELSDLLWGKGEREEEEGSGEKYRELKEEVFKASKDLHGSVEAQDLKTGLKECQGLRDELRIRGIENNLFVKDEE